MARLVRSDARGSTINPVTGYHVPNSRSIGSKSTTGSKRKTTGSKNTQRKQP